MGEIKTEEKIEKRVFYTDSLMTLTSFMFGKPQMSVLNLLQCKQCNTCCCLWLENVPSLEVGLLHLTSDTHFHHIYDTIYILFLQGDFFPYKQPATLVITGHLLPALLWQNLYDWIQVWLNTGYKHNSVIHIYMDTHPAENYSDKTLPLERFCWTHACIFQYKTLHTQTNKQQKQCH